MKKNEIKKYYKEARKLSNNKIYGTICMIVAASFYLYSNFINIDQSNVTLKKCVDGDTARFIVNNEEEIVRFLAIDTPETSHPTIGKEPFGPQASNFTCDSLRNASEITLEFDPDSDKKDKYDRLLAWVFVDGKLLQEELVSEGLAEVAYLYGDYKYTYKLEDAQEIAKENKKNIWK